MSDKLKALYELQNIDMQLSKVKRTLASLDDGSTKKQAVEAATAQAEQANKLLHEATTEQRDKELNLKTIEVKEKTYRDKLYAGMVTNPKELSSMEKEIEMLEKQQGKLEERILELMDIVEERKTAVANAQTTLKDAEQSLADHLTKLQKDKAILSTKAHELMPKRETAAAKIDPILMKRYDAMRVRLGGLVVSKIDTVSGSACHTQITGGLMIELRKHPEMQTCDNCGRILYMESTNEESSDRG